ncbi:MAG: ABC transporter ATP-binding protein [Rubritepida sp.]|nr:ABC transporter ATP-binding protein [Rubritepida sp.]
MLDVRDLHAGYGEARVLHGISLTVEPGQVHALLGRNGMGKTTLVRAMMGLAAPHVTAGEVRLGATRLTGLKPHLIARAGVALVPQGRRVFASLTVMEHLTMLKPAQARGGWTVARVMQAFPRLAERRQHRGNQLSGGERQMLAVGRALMADPAFILMDEPSEGLAPVMVQALEGVVALLRDEGLGVLLVEQNLYSALAVADRVSVMEGGVIVHAASRADSPTELLTRFLGVH